MKKRLFVSACALLLLAAWGLLANRQLESPASPKSSAGKCNRPASPKTGTGFLITDSFSGFF
jgi:hypothetical protein